MLLPFPWLSWRPRALLSAVTATRTAAYRSSFLLSLLSQWVFLADGSSLLVFVVKKQQLVLMDGRRKKPAAAKELRCARTYVTYTYNYARRTKRAAKYEMNFSAPNIIAMAKEQRVVLTRAARVKGKKEKL